MSSEASKNHQDNTRSARWRGMVLLDVLDDDEERFDVSFLERIDHPVTVCHGPTRGTVCPLLADGMCEKYEHAHGIMFELDLDDAQHRAIVAKYRRLNPEIPIRVVVDPDQLERYHHVLSGVEVWLRLPSVADLDGFAAEVEAADRYAAQNDASPGENAPDDIGDRSQNRRSARWASDVIDDHPAAFRNRRVTLARHSNHADRARERTF